MLHFYFSNSLFFLLFQLLDFALHVVFESILVAALL
jgi:hypothetical protein